MKKGIDFIIEFIILINIVHCLAYRMNTTIIAIINLLGYQHEYANLKIIIIFLYVCVQKIMEPFLKIREWIHFWKPVLSVL